MTFYEPTARTPQLLGQLVEVWEASVRATHHFLSDAEIERIKSYVPQALGGVEHLVIAEEQPSVPVAFLGVEKGRLEMLFLSPAQRGQGLGRQLIQYGIQHYGVQEVTVNEQNPQAVGFYEHLGFVTYKRTDHDEEGGPYPLLYMKRRDTMTEKEKMVSQKLYDANYNADILAERSRAKDLCWQYNQLRPSDEEGHQKILRELLGKTGASAIITPPFWCDYGYNIELGENFYSNHNLVILDGARVTFGDNVFVAPDCGFHTAGHPIDAERRNQGLEYAYPITVGSNVWIGAGVQVMPGVTIGDNVVIGGGSVVVKDIPSNSVAVGNPCHVIRPITDEDKKTCWDR